MNGALIWIAVLQVLTVIIGLARGKVLSQLLGPAHFGVISTIDQLILLLVNAGSLSLSYTAVKFISWSHSEGQERFESASAGYMRLLVFLSLATTLICSLVLVANSAAFGSELVPYKPFIRIALIGIPALMVQPLLVGITAAAQRPLAAAGLSLGFAVVVAAGAIAGITLHGLSGLYLGTVAGGLLVVGSSFWYVSRSLGIRFANRSVPLLSELRRNPALLSFAVCMYVVQGVNAVTMMAARYAVLAAQGEAATGLLQASLSIAMTVGAVLTAMSTFYLMPLMNRQGAPADKMVAANQFIGRMLVLLLIGALPVVLVPGILINVLYTGAFAAAASTLYLFILWQCILQVGVVYQHVLIGLDDIRFVAISSTTGFGTAAALTFLLVPRVGFGGAAVALGIGMLIYGGLAALRLRTRHGLVIPGAIAWRALLVSGVVTVAGLLFGHGGEATAMAVLQRFGFAVLAFTALWFSMAASERGQLIAQFFEVVRVAESRIDAARTRR